MPSGARKGVSRRYETRMVHIPYGTSRADARQLLADHAEYGQWEMQRAVTFRDGSRRVWLRRRVMTVRKTAA